MKLVKVIYILLTGSALLYLYSNVMPKDGLVNGILYFVIGIPLALIIMSLLLHLFDKLLKKTD
ncbi:hypothetical protein [Jeotgalibacillus proteolyticus]|uniref:Uncharacterized protein n=1 Tax=Jeotgalibacillus proteolyticus TaxID=2082395 RepID=A0A2S5GDQ5_9BACL|nr:hypothetical protein [Jeotgalibacillus proteolyticus]PPA71172.1 hypothetical protein C4B60_03640 [Jeotgalibacillus proteolyticus]